MVVLTPEQHEVFRTDGVVKVPADSVRFYFDHLDRFPVGWSRN